MNARKDEARSDVYGQGIEESREGRRKPPARAGSPGGAPSAKRGMALILGACALLLLPGLGFEEQRTQADGEREVQAEIVLIAGEKKSVDVGAARRVAISNPDVLDVEVASDGWVILQGISGGEATLIVWAHDDTREQLLVIVREE